MSVSGKIKNRGAHGDSSFMLGQFYAHRARTEAIYAVQEAKCK